VYASVGIQFNNLSEFKGGSLRDVATTFNLQSVQLVTNMSVSLSGTPFFNRPISSIGVANCDRISLDNPAAML